MAVDTLPSGGAAAWQTHQRGCLVLHVRPHSPAAHDVDELAARYTEALATVADALEVDADALPSIAVYLADLPSDDPRVATDVGDATVAPEPTSPHVLTVWTAYGAEAGEPVAEAELAHALLSYGLGPAPPQACFWDEGLAGYLAARSGRSTYHAEATAHCRQLLHDGVLPPLSELVAEAGERLAAVGSTAATAFAEYLVERHGLPRYQQLLRAARAGHADPFAEVYRQPLAVADRDWRRHLEATGEAHAPSLWVTLGRLLPVARPYWRSGLVILVCSLASVAFSLALPLGFRFLIDNVLGRRPLQEPIPFVGPRGYVIAEGAEQLEALILLLTVLGLLYGLNAAARLGMNLLLARTGEAFSFDLRRRLLGVLERLPTAFYARRTHADISQRVVHDVEAVQQVIARAAVPMFTGALAILFFAGLLVALNATLAVVALVGLPVVALIHGLRRRGRRAAVRERVRRMADLSAGVNELAAAHVLAKLYAAGPYLGQRLRRRLDVHRELNAAFTRESALLAQAGTLALGLTQVAVLLVGGYLVIASDGQDLAPGGLVAFYITLSQLLGPVGQVSAANQTVAGASASVERVAGLLAEPTEDEPAEGRDVGPLRQAIHFEGVSFGYPGGPRVLKGLTLAIPAGSTVAFVGPTGAGKSSILRLLPRLYDPTQGVIRWDGLDLRAVRPGALRRQIGLVPQDALLLSATLYENIRFGLEGVSAEDVRRAARLARADDFIAALPDGYDTVVGERGVGLSGGQRQRIALARALLRQPSVLILDEATSALDPTTQRTVQAVLRDGAPERTVIKVAHRLETVVDADQIFVLDDGRLVEQGTHDELLARGGLYAHLFEDQLGALQQITTPSARLVARYLARRAPFSELPSAGLDALARVLRPLDVQGGAELYHQGDPAEHAYVLLRGRAEQVRQHRDGRVTVSPIGPGATFGVSSFLGRAARPATVRVVVDAGLYVLDRPNWEAVQRADRPGPSETAVAAGHADHAAAG